MQQAQVREAGMRAEAEARGRSANLGSEQAQQAQEKTADPNSNFPEPAMDSPEQVEAIMANQGPAEALQGVKIGNKESLHAPVVGESREQDVPSDVTAGVNRSVGQFNTSVGDTEAGRKGTGGVDFSNSTV